MITQTAEFALRSVVALARAGDVPLAVDEIAARARIRSTYLAKILQTLARAGLVRGRRGSAGGYRLARPASEITVLDVVSAVDPIRRIRSCPLELPEHANELCPLHRRIDDAAALIEDTLRACCIAGLSLEIAEADAAAAARNAPPGLRADPQMEPPPAAASAGGPETEEAPPCPT